MIEVRAKDIIFIAAAAPLAAIAAYVWCWRIDEAKHIDALIRERDSLIEAADYPMAKRRAESRLSDAQVDLEEEKRAPQPERKVIANYNASAAARESGVLKIFAAAGLVVTRSELVEDAQTGDAANALAGSRDATSQFSPILRRYTLDGTYPAVRRALDLFASAKAAVIVEKLEMRQATAGKWKLEVWL